MTDLVYPTPITDPHDQSVRDRIYVLSKAQCRDHEIVAKLAYEFDAIDYETFDAHLSSPAMTAQCERWRHEGQADARIDLHAIATDNDAARNCNGSRLQMLVRFAEQHLDWAREPVLDNLRRSYDAAKREKARGKSKPKAVAG